MFELDVVWRGLLGTLSAVKDTQGQVRDENLGTDLPFNAYA